MKMTKMTILQKILTTVIAVFGAGGVVVFFLPQMAHIADQVTNICAMVSECVAVASGIWLSTTSDKVLTQEEVAAKEEAAKEKQFARAKALIAKNEKDAESLQQAKSLVAQVEAEKALKEAQQQK